MPEYKNNLEGLKKLRIGLTKILILFYGVVVLTVVLVSISNGEKYGALDWVLSAILTFVLFAYVIIRSISRQKKIYRSYELRIGTDFLSRNQKNLQPVTLCFNDIVSVVENKHCTLIVNGKNPKDTIIISSYIENYDQIKDLLKSITPIVKKNNQNLFQKYPYVIPVLTIAAIVAIYCSNNKIVIVASGLILIGTLSWSFYKIRTAPQLDSRIKSYSWWTFVVLACVIAIVYYKVFYL